MPTSLIFYWDDTLHRNIINKFFLELPKGPYIIKPYSYPRNLDQNKLYHLLLGWVEKETGNDHEYLHEMMKKKFLAGPKKRIKLKGKVTYERKLGSTTKLNTKQFSEFYQKVEIFF